MVKKEREQLKQIEAAFLAIKSEKVKDLIVSFLDKISSLSQNNENIPTVEVILSLKTMINFVGHGNSKYLSRFMKFLVLTDSNDMKERVIDLVESFIDEEKITN